MKCFVFKFSIIIVAVFSIVAMQEDKSAFPSLSDLAAKVVAKDYVDHHKKIPKDLPQKLVVLIKKDLPKKCRNYPRLTLGNVIDQKKEAHEFKDSERVKECSEFILKRVMPLRIKYYMQPDEYRKDFKIALIQKKSCWDMVLMVQ